MRDFHQLVGRTWDEVKSLSEDYKLVIVFKDTIEAVN